MNSYIKSKKTIVLVMIASIAIGFFWGLYFQAPGVVKAIFSALMILSALVFPYGYIRNNDFDKISNTILRVIILLSVVAVLRSVFNEEADMYAFGNKWMTLFGNEYCALLLFPPLFTYLATEPANILYAERINYQYMLIGAFFIFLFKFPLATIVLVLPVFVPYVKRSYKLLIGVAVLHAVLGGTLGLNPTRANFLYLLFAFAAFFLVFVIKKIAITKIFCISCLILPFILFVSMLYSNNRNESSFFESAQTYIIGKTDDRDLASDTRTFLYREMALDLTKTNSWMFGKGAFAHYYSLWFDRGVNGRYGRLGSEVPFLNFLMHGGVVYVAFYFLLLIYAVYKGLWKSNNRFVQCIAVVVTGWFFCSFVCDLTGARYYHVFFFMLLGCCLSNRFLNMNDDEIAMLFNEGEYV